jgi:hypothetical protein
MNELDDYQLPPATITPRMRPLWQETTKWALFSSIVGFLGVLMLLFYLAVAFVTVYTVSQTYAEAFSAGSPARGRVAGLALVSGFALLLAVAQFLGHLYHLRFASRLQNALNADSQEAFEQAWHHLRLHFRFYCLTLIVGVLLAVGLLVYLMRTLPFLVGGLE